MLLSYNEKDRNITKVIKLLKKDKFLKSCTSTLNHIISLNKNQIFKSCTNVLEFITRYWVFLAVVGTTCGLYIFNVDPGYYFHHIGFQQKQERLQEDQEILKYKFTQFHNKLGREFLYIEQFNASRDEFNQVLKVDPLNQNASKGLFFCDVFSKAKNNSIEHEITYKQLDAIKTEYPDDPLPYLFLGEFNFVRGFMPEAADNYQKAIEKDSSVAAAYEGLGMVYALQNRDDLALKYFKEAANRSKWNLRYQYNLANRYYELKDYKQAIVWYKVTLVLNPNYIDAYSSCSNACLCIGDLENASILQEKQIELLEDYSTETLTYNQNPYYYTNNKGDEITLDTYAKKKYYFYYNAALTYYLLGNENKTIELKKKANNLHIGKESESQVKVILNDEIEKLQKTQPIFMDKTIEFRNKFE